MQFLSPVSNNPNDSFKKELKHNFVANVALSSMFEKMSKENQLLQKKLEDCKVNLREETKSKFRFQRRQGRQTQAKKKDKGRSSKII